MSALGLKRTKSDFGWDFAPDPTEGANSAPGSPGCIKGRRGIDGEGEGGG